MKHIQRLIQEDPRLRHVDYQLLVQKAKVDPNAHWEELVRTSAPIVHTAAWRLAEHLPEGASVAEEVTRQVFEAIAGNDYEILRSYIGYGKWPSLLVRLTQQSPLLAERRRDREYPELPSEGRPPIALADPDGPIGPLSPQIEELCEKEGQPFLQALRKSVRILHRRDRLMLAMRYEQGLTLAELDQLFRLGTPDRVAALLKRIRQNLQPFRAVAEAWQLPEDQEEPLLRFTLGRILREHSMATVDEDKLAPAVASH
jgi:hypothetical protein